MSQNQSGISGKLIVFEGPDGTGKSTQLQLLAQSLTDAGYDVITTCEPTSGSYGQKIRELYMNRDCVTPEEELELFILDRREHVEQVIQPSLDAGKIILTDRYFLSTVAYQGAKGFDVEEIFAKNSFAPTPDIAFIFQASPETSIQRITQNRGDCLNDFEKKDSLIAVSQIFDSMKQGYIQFINAEKSIEVIQQQIRAAVEPLLSFGEEKQEIP